MSMIAIGFIRFKLLCIILRACVMPYAQDLAARPQTSDVATELAAMQVAALTQVQHGHLEMMKQLEKREARLRTEQQLLNDRTRVLAQREHMLARTLCNANHQYAVYCT